MEDQTVVSAPAPLTLQQAIDVKLALANTNLETARVEVARLEALASSFSTECKALTHDDLTAEIEAFFKSV